MTNIEALPNAFAQYTEHGWKLVPIPHGEKRPRATNWNRLENVVSDGYALSGSQNVGLAHAYSGTMALDIDDWNRAVQELMKHGIDLTALYEAPDAVIIDSSRPGHGKLLYAMPAGLVLPSKKLIDAHADGTKYNYIDFRCATSNGLTVQDVLPPSTHPDTNQPYRWSGRGHWTRLPQIPAPLLALWQSLLDGDRTRNISNDQTHDTSWAEIRSALEAISPDVSREEWIDIGMALHWAGTQANAVDQAFALWDEWSRMSAAKYPGERQIRVQWASFRTDKHTTVRINTLFHHALAAGWKPAPIDVSAMFAPLDTPVAIKPVLYRANPPSLDPDVMPASITVYAREISDAVGCDILVPFAAGLAAVSAAADARSRLELMPGFSVSPVIWCMTIGQPADKKSPGSRPMLAPLLEIERDHVQQFAEDMLRWEAEEAAHSSAKKAYLSMAGDPEHMLATGGNVSQGLPTVPVLRPQPVPKRLIVADATSQKVVRLAADRPEGLLCSLDEMNGFLTRICDPKSGDDRSTWVQGYEAQPYILDRVGTGSIRAENFAIAMYGNVQPKVLDRQLANLSNDGFLQRFLPFSLRPEETRVGNPVPGWLSVAPQWIATLRRVHATGERSYRLSFIASAMFREFQYWYEDQKRTERLAGSSDTFMTAFGKLEGLCGRITLLFHLCDNPEAPEVSPDTMDRAIRFVKEYVVRSFHFNYEDRSEQKHETWIAEHILVCAPSGEITCSEIKRSGRHRFNDISDWQTTQIIETTMAELEKVGWVVTTVENRKTHAWAINPSLINLWRDHRDTIVEAKRKIAEMIDYQTGSTSSMDRLKKSRYAA